MIDTDDFFKWIAFIIYPITHIKNRFIQFILILSLFIICYISTNYWSKKSQNQKFKKFVQEKLEYDKRPMSYIMQHGVINFRGTDNIAEFFTHLMEVNLDIYTEYKNKVKIWQVVVNEMPSYVYQLNGDEKNDINIKEKTDSMVTDNNKEIGYSYLQNRKENIDKNPIIRHLSVYWKNGINQQAFEDNIKNTNGVSSEVNIDNNKSFGANLLSNKGKINGLKIKNSEMIPEHLYGQFIIIKKNTGAILIFKESGGEQKRITNITNKNKQLQFFYCENKYDIIYFDKDLYKIIDFAGILDDL